MRAENRKDERFIKASASHPCPICGMSDWCGFNSYIVSCMRVQEGSFKTVTQSNGNDAYLHWLESGRVNRLPALMKDDSVKSAQTAPVEVRDRVYREFLRLLYMHPRHEEDLIRRGLTEWEIRKNGYRSVPKTDPPWSLCTRLIRMGHDLDGIPGFYKARGRNGGTYWTFDRQPGYFIPVRDEKGRIQALQRRMDDTRGGKYRLFSGHQKQGGCSSGTPAHVASPVEVKDSRIWITEGPLKADIAGKYLGAVVVGAMSAGAWCPAIQAILAIKSEKAVVIAYDRDLETNPNVARAYFTLKAELEKHDMTVSQALWKGVKGIDDALAGGMQVKVVRMDKIVKERR